MRHARQLRRSLPRHPRQRPHEYSLAVTARASQCSTALTPCTHRRPRPARGRFVSSARRDAPRHVQAAPPAPPPRSSVVAASRRRRHCRRPYPHRPRHSQRRCCHQRRPASQRPPRRRVPRCCAAWRLPPTMRPRAACAIAAALRPHLSRVACVPHPLSAVWRCRQVPTACLVSSRNSAAWAARMRVHSAKAWAHPATPHPRLAPSLNGVSSAALQGPGSRVQGHPSIDSAVHPPPPHPHASPSARRAT